MILGEIRNVARAHACLKNGQWRRTFPNSSAIPELCGKTVGLVGYGRVGRLVAHYLEAFGSRILACDPLATGDPAPATMVDLEMLLKEADVVSIHARLSDETFHLIGEMELALMKPTAVLVNTARSGLVDEDALVEALAHRRIMGAALDVFDVEPLQHDRRLPQQPETDGRPSRPHAPRRKRPAGRQRREAAVETWRVVERGTWRLELEA